MNTDSKFLYDYIAITTHPHKPGKSKNKDILHSTIRAEDLSLIGTIEISKKIANEIEYWASLRGYKQFHMSVYNKEKIKVLNFIFSRNFLWWPSAEIRNFHGKLIGTIKQHYRPFLNSFSLHDISNNAVINTRNLSFNLSNYSFYKDNQEVCSIQKGTPASVEQFMDLNDEYHLTFNGLEDNSNFKPILLCFYVWLHVYQSHYGRRIILYRIYLVFFIAIIIVLMGAISSFVHYLINN